MPTDGTTLSAKTLYGEVNYFGFDGPIGDALRLYGQWAKSEIEFLRQFISQGDTVVDGGANIGTHTLGFAQSCGPEGSVIAVEASPEVAALLEKTVQANNLTQVRIINAALSDDTGISMIPRLDPGKPQNTGMLQPVRSEDNCGSGLPVQRITLDSLALTNLSLLKLDIEGGELNALMGSQDTIKKLRPVVSAEALTLSSSLSVMNFMDSLGYKSFFCSFPAYDPSNFNRNDENIFGYAREASLIFLPSLSSIPAVTDGAFVSSVNNADDLARLIAEMSRYGDRTDHDRISEIVARERDALKEIVELNAVALNKAEVNMQAELKHLWHYLEKNQQELARVSEKVSETESLLRHKDEAHSTLAADFHSMKVDFSKKSADNERDVERIMKAQEALSAATNSNRDEILAFISSEVKALQRSVSQNIESELAEVKRDYDKVIAALKAELTSLREVIFERDETRSKTVLEFERIENKAKHDLSVESEKLTQRLVEIENSSRQASEGLDKANRSIIDIGSNLTALDQRAGAVEESVRSIAQIKLDTSDLSSRIEAVESTNKSIDQIRSEVSELISRMSSFWARLNFPTKRGVNK